MRVTTINASTRTSDEKEPREGRSPISVDTGCAVSAPPTPAFCCRRSNGIESGLLPRARCTIPASAISARVEPIDDAAHVLARHRQDHEDPDEHDERRNEDLQRAHEERAEEPEDAA